MTLDRYVTKVHGGFADLFRVSESDYSIKGRVGGLLIFSVREPKLNFGGQYISAALPREFKDIWRFYTGDKQLKVIFKFYYPSNDTLTSNFLRFLKQGGQRLNFQVDLTPIPVSTTSHSNLYDYIISDFQRGSATSGTIIGAVVVRFKGLFEKVKAFSIIRGVPSHLINVNKLRKIVNKECRGSEHQDLMRCNAYNAYVLNNVVQLYAKAGGIPWVPGDTKLLDRVAVVGLATAKMDREYVIGVAFSVAYLGKEIKSFISARTFERGMLKEDVLRSQGIYIPRQVAEELLLSINSLCRRHNIKGYVIFQSPVILDEEIEGAKEALKGFPWVLVHVKSDGFSKRIYDISTEDWAPYRGLCVVSEDYINTFKQTGFLKIVLTVTGVARIPGKGLGGSKQEIKLYKGTPKPLELEVHVSRDHAKDVDAQHLALYVSRVALLLSKLDWEAYTSWPKIPFVVKYAQRLAQIIARVDKDLREAVLKAIGLGGVELRFVM